MYIYLYIYNYIQNMYTHPAYMHAIYIYVRNMLLHRSNPGNLLISESLNGPFATKEALDDYRVDII